MVCDCVLNITNYDLLKEIDKRINEGTLTKRHVNKYNDNGELYTEISLQDNPQDSNLTIIISHLY